MYYSPQDRSLCLDSRKHPRTRPILCRLVFFRRAVYLAVYLKMVMTMMKVHACLNSMRFGLGLGLGLGTTTLDYISVITCNSTLTSAQCLCKRGLDGRSIYVCDYVCFLTKRKKLYYRHFVKSYFQTLFYVGAGAIALQTSAMPPKCDIKHFNELKASAYVYRAVCGCSCVSDNGDKISIFSSYSLCIVTVFVRIRSLSCSAPNGSVTILEIYDVLVAALWSFREFLYCTLLTARPPWRPNHSCETIDPV